MDALKFAVIHSLEKEKGNNAASFTLAPKLLDVTQEPVAKLSDRLTKLIGVDGSSLQWGQFNDNRREGPFPTSVQGLIPKLTAKTFLAMAKVAMEELRSEVNGKNFATGGYICFLAYESGRDTFLLIAMIKERSALQLSPQFEPLEIQEIDLSKLHQAARINLNRYEESLKDTSDSETEEDEDGTVEKTYLCFAKTKAEGEVSDYFTIALGCVEGISSKRATKALLKGLNEYIKTNEPIKSYAGSAKASVVDFLMSRSDGHVIHLDHVITAARQVVPPDLASYFDGLKAFLSDERQKVPHEFVVDHKALTPWVRIKSQGNGWKITFENRLLGYQDSAIVYDPKSRALTFTQLSEKTVADIESELRARAPVKVKS